MLDVMIVGLLALVGGVSLGIGVSTLYAYRRVSTLEARVSSLESENRGLRQLLEEKARRLEEADRSLRAILEERDSRLRLLEEKLGELEDRLGEVSSRMSMLSDLVGSLVKQPEEPSGETESKVSLKPKELEEDPELIDMRILVLRRQGYSIRKIAQELGIPKSTVHKRLKRLLETKQSS